MSQAPHSQQPATACEGIIGHVERHKYSFTGGHVSIPTSLHPPSTHVCRSVDPVGEGPPHESDQSLRPKAMIVAEVPAGRIVVRSSTSVTCPFGDAGISPHSVQHVRSEVPLVNPHSGLSAAHLPHPGNFVASRSPTNSSEGVGVVDGLSISAKQWSSCRTSKRARDYFAAPTPVWLESDPPSAVVPRLAEPSRAQPVWPIDAAFSPEVQSGRSLVNPFGILSGDRQPRPCRVRASCSPTNSPEGVGAGDGLSTIVCSTQSSAAGWPRDATIPRDIQYRSSAVSLCNPVTALAGAHHPRPGDTIASCSPTTSSGGVGVVDGVSIIANQWSSRRNGKHAKD